MASAAENEITQLKKEVLRLKETNQQLEYRVNDKNPPMTNDTADGIVAVILILVIAFGFSFWLGHMPG